MAREKKNNHPSYLFFQLNLGSRSISVESNGSDCSICINLLMECKICRREKRLFDRDFFLSILQERERMMHHPPQAVPPSFDIDQNGKRSTSKAKSKKSRLQSKSRSRSERRDTKRKIDRDRSNSRS